MAGIIVIAIVGAASYFHLAADLAGLGAGVGFDSSKKIPLWWVVDNSQVNSRQWLDLGNRSTRQPN